MGIFHSPNSGAHLVFSNEELMASNATITFMIKSLSRLE